MKCRPAVFLRGSSGIISTTIELCKHLILPYPPILEDSMKHYRAVGGCKRLTKQDSLTGLVVHVIV